MAMARVVWLCRSFGYAYFLQRLLGGRFSRAFRRFGADRRHSVALEYINQLRYSRPPGQSMHRRWRAFSGCGPIMHDDARSDVRPLASGILACHRVRFAAAVRNRNRWRADCRPACIDVFYPAHRSARFVCGAMATRYTRPKSNFKVYLKDPLSLKAAIWRAGRLYSSHLHAERTPGIRPGHERPGEDYVGRSHSNGAPAQPQHDRRADRDR